MPKFAIIIYLLILTLLSACNTGFNQLFEEEQDDSNAAGCNQDPVFTNFIAQGQFSANLRTNNVLTLFAELGCNQVDGILSGQNIGTLANENYAGLIDGINDSDNTQYTPAIAGVHITTLAENEPSSFASGDTYQTLRQHWDDGGFISISWTPENPWKDAPEDNELAYTNSVDLAMLANGANTTTATDRSANTYWLQQIERLTEFLETFKNTNITVLLRPLPNMNVADYWWGVEASGNESARYTRLWNQVFDALRDEDLNHVLWVYSPRLRASGDDSRSIDWAYPGENRVDIVAPILRNSSLTISNTEYDEMLAFDKVLGLGEAGPERFSSASIPENNSDKASFDNQLFDDVILSNRTEIAYWVSWYDLERSDNNNQITRSRHSLVYTTNAIELFEGNNNILTSERVTEQALKRDLDTN